MSREKFLRLYVQFNIAIGFLLVLFEILFIAQIPKDVNALVSSNLFGYVLITYTGNLTYVNTPLIVLLSLFVLNLYMLIRVGNTNDIQKKPLQTVVFYNFVLGLMMILGQMAFMVMLPETLNGTVLNRFLFITFHVNTGEAYHVVFTNYVLSIVYFIYNVVVYGNTTDKKEEKNNNEVYSEKLLKELNK